MIIIIINNINNINVIMINTIILLGSWIDPTKDGFIIKEGYGTLRTPTRIYSGYFKNDKPEGLGSLLILDKPEGVYLFKGMFHDGEKRTGKLVFPDKSVMHGEFSNDFKSRKGTITEISNRYGILSMQGEFDGNGNGSCITIKYYNGTSYFGQTKGYMKYGKGVFLNDNGKYKGHFINDCLYHGKHLDLDENIYEGFFTEYDGNYVYDGYGFIYYSDGREYHGTYVKGLEDGDGLLYDNNDTHHMFKCHYKNGLRYSCTYLGEFIE